MPNQLLRPYAAKAIVEHHFDIDHLDIYVTFRFEMDTTVKPANELWIVEVDDAEEFPNASTGIVLSHQVWTKSYPIFF
ncbi:unnamed protein product [marine sediment metagenome]|uniref:Uncharacterized protein n=1 Tax=marine sediment metagenome TaxID=412755 RepID=X1ABR0_9ZZZZ